jgi:GTP-binding protein HflX
VGFIRDLPHGLVEAFAATLQEAADADLLLHVVDASNPEHLEQIAAVERVLGEIGAADLPQLLVFNKIDALDAAIAPRQRVDTMEVGGRSLPRLFVSAHAGTGLPELRAWLAAEVARRSASPAPQDPVQALESGNRPA